MGFAAKKQFLSNAPLPKHPITDGAYFINLAYPEKIKMVYDAIVVFRQPDWRDHFRQRTRHILDREVLLETRPELKKREVVERKKLDFRNINFIGRLSPRAKLGALLNQIALNAATIKSKGKQKKVWPTIKSTKLAKRKK